MEGLLNALYTVLMTDTSAMLERSSFQNYFLYVKITWNVKTAAQWKQLIELLKWSIEEAVATRHHWSLGL